jgi:hypothetical protein
LVDLNELRIELGIDASELNSLMDPDTKRLEKAKSAGQPFLLHIRALFLPFFLKLYDVGCTLQVMFCKQLVSLYRLST